MELWFQVSCDKKSIRLGTRKDCSLTGQIRTSKPRKTACIEPFRYSCSRQERVVSFHLSGFYLLNPPGRSCFEQHINSDYPIHNFHARTSQHLP